MHSHFTNKFCTSRDELQRIAEYPNDYSYKKNLYTKTTDYNRYV